MHIGIAGNIGCGKTTLTRMLSEHYGWTPKYEAVTYNPYLEDYYKDIKRWSFNLEVYFLEQRFKDVLEIARSRKTIIQDRTIFEGVYIFVANNYAMGNLSKRDFRTYMELFELMMSLVKAPDLMIYLRSSIPHLVAQIQKRGRDYEQSISIEYLKGLNDRMIYIRSSVPRLIDNIQKRGRSYEQTIRIDYLRGLNDRYEKFISEDYKGRVLILDGDSLDFQNRPEDFESITEKIDAELYGLFSK